MYSALSSCIRSASKMRDSTPVETFCFWARWTMSPASMPSLMQPRRWQYLFSPLPDQLEALVNVAPHAAHGPPSTMTGIAGQHPVHRERRASGAAQPRAGAVQPGAPRCIGFGH